MTDRELAGCAPDEKGPFRVVEHEGGRISVASDDFTHDVWLRVTGDFGSEAVHRHYAEWVAATLNAALSTPSSEGDGRDAEDARAWRQWCESVGAEQIVALNEKFGGALGLVRDAERYRWLRHQDNYWDADKEIVAAVMHGGRRMDEAVDAAMAKERE